MGSLALPSEHGGRLSTDLMWAGFLVLEVGVKTGHGGISRRFPQRKNHTLTVATAC